MTNKWQQIKQLVKKTGDRLVVLDELVNEVYVVMPLSKYDELLSVNIGSKNLTDEDILAKINRDISLLQLDREDEKNEFLELTKEDEGDDQYYIEPVE